MTIEQTQYIMTFIQANLPNGAQKSTDERVIKMQLVGWFHNLQAFDYEVCMKAALKIIGEVKFMPTLSEYIAEVRKIMFPDLGVVSPEEAYGKVMRLAEKVGRYRKAEAMVQLDEVSKDAIESMGGWDTLTDGYIHDSALRARFCNAYKAIEERHLQKAMSIDMQDALRIAQEAAQPLLKANEPLITPEKLRAAKTVYDGERGNL